VLEMGCGTGVIWSAWLACTRARAFYGLDASEEMLKTAQANLMRAKQRGQRPTAAFIGRESQSFNTFNLDKLST